MTALYIGIAVVLLVLLGAGLAICLTADRQRSRQSRLREERQRVVADTEQALHSMTAQTLRDMNRVIREQHRQ